MKSPVGGILIFSSAIRADGKTGHGGLLAVIRSAGDDREPWSAIRAIQKRITKPAILRIEQFGQTCVTSRRIGRDGNRTQPALIAGFNKEAAIPARRARLPGKGFDSR